MFGAIVGLAKIVSLGALAVLRVVRDEPSDAQDTPAVVPVDRSREAADWATASRPAYRPSPLDMPTGRSRLEVCWAEVSFSDGSGSKVRPVVIVDSTPCGYYVLTMTSRKPKCLTGYLGISSASSRSYDQKGQPSWVDCRELVWIPREERRFPSRTGRLNFIESQLCLAMVSHVDAAA